MKIQKFDEYFTFTLDEGEFTRYSYPRILEFLKAIKKSIPVEGRNFFDAEKTWQIQNEYLQTFQELKDRYLDINKTQGELKL
jgi:hypothetical protein